MTTLSQARDDINGRLKAAVDAYNTANTTSIKIYSEDVEEPPQDAKVAQLRGPYVKHNLGDDQTLGPTGGRVFDRSGILIVQVMTPFGDGFTLADALATVARNAYEGVSTPNGVWFRKATVKEVGKTGGFYQTNVVANFEYTELR